MYHNKITSMDMDNEYLDISEVAIHINGKFALVQNIEGDIANGLRELAKYYEIDIIYGEFDYSDVKEFIGRQEFVIPAFTLKHELHYINPDPHAVELFK